MYACVRAHARRRTCVRMFVCMNVRACVYVCVCVRERQRERVCVCVCV